MYSAQGTDAVPLGWSFLIVLESLEVGHYWERRVSGVWEILVLTTTLKAVVWHRLFFQLKSDDKHGWLGWVKGDYLDL